MSFVQGRVLRSSITADLFVDITGPNVRLVGVRSDGLTFDGDLTPEQAAAIRDRMGARDDRDQAERTKAATAFKVNRDFLAVAAPTNAQVLAQVRALSRQNQGILRILLGRYNEAD